jgi:hypothetical protein
MAGEIQLNSTTFASESSGSITAELDTIRPNTTNGSLTLQGDNSNAGVTGLTIDSSGNATFAQTITGGTLGSSVVFPAGHVIQFVRPAVSVEQNALTTSYVNYYEVSITLKSSNSDVFILHTFNGADSQASGFGQKIYRSSTSSVTTSDTVVFNYGAVDSNGPLGWYSTGSQLFFTTTTQAVDIITGQSSGDTLYYGFFYAKRGGTVFVPASNSPSNGFFSTVLFEIQK